MTFQPIKVGGRLGDDVNGVMLFRAWVNEMRPNKSGATNDEYDCHLHTRSSKPTTRTEN